MRMRVMAVGTRLPAWARSACDEYLTRLSALNLTLVQLEPARRAGAAATRAVAAEGARLLGMLRPAEHVVALDERGKELSTRELAAWLKGRQQAGEDLAFLIGGADGLAPEVLARSQFRWSLSRLTLPHALARVLAHRAALPCPQHSHQSPVSSRLMPAPPSQPAVCLASMSPRRRELLAQIGVPHRVSAPHIDETVQPGEPAADYVVRMARSKALTVADTSRGCRCSPPTPSSSSTSAFSASPPAPPRASPCSSSSRAARTRCSRRSRSPARAGLAFRLSASEVRFRRLSRAECLSYWESRGAARQGRRLRRAGARGGVHRVPRRQLLGRHGAAAVRDRATAARRRRAVLAERRAPGGGAVTLEILVNVAPRETRAALLESGVVQELHVERTSRRGLVSNLYKGRVSRVLPGMQAAFVEIGLERTAFLHAADIAGPRSEDTLVGASLPLARGHPPPGERRR